LVKENENGNGSPIAPPLALPAVDHPDERVRERSVKSAESASPISRQAFATLNSVAGRDLDALTAALILCTNP
jgi:hypothetical protein